AEDAASKPAGPDAAAAPNSDTQSRSDTLAESDKAAMPDGAAGDKSAVTAGTKSADAEPKVTVDAVEVEDGKLFVAGSAKDKAPVRVYLDGKLVGEAKPEESGRWLLETKRSVEPGRRVVR